MKRFKVSCTLLLLLPIVAQATSTSFCKSGSSARELECYVQTPEHEPVGTVLIDFTNERELKQLLPNGFKVTPDGQAEDRYVQMANGVMKIREQIDREAVCDTEPRAECSIKLLATASSVNSTNKQFYSLSITVVVLNVNEPPRFRSSTDSIAVDELLPINSNITYRMQITDDDVLRFTAYDPTGTFQMLSHSKNALVLRLVKPLDYETENRYLINVTAYDSSYLSASLDLTVSVIDANDNDPVFTSLANDTFNVPDDTARDTQIARISASDRDSGDNGVVAYAFENLRPSQPFDIDAQSGIIRTTGSLSIRQRDAAVFAHKLTVVAFDRGSPPRTATTSVTINVVDANDREPVIRAGEDGPMTVPEETTPFKVGVIIVSDADVGDNSRTSCRVDSTYRFNLTELKRWGPPDYSSKYELILNERLDFDSASSDVVQATVTCHDFGNPQHTSRATFDVHVLPSNEFAPQFDDTTYRFSLEENQYTQSIRMFPATDRDRDAELAYRIEPTPRREVDYQLLDEYFEIDAASAILRLRKPLDREAHSNFTFLLVAVDRKPNNDNVSFSATATIVVDVIDVNDNVPECAESVLNVSENRETGYGIGQVAAHDPDGHPLHFSLPNGDRNMDSSLIMNTTGYLFTGEQFDRERRAEYRLNVTVSDGEFLLQCAVRVNVLDENDNAPLWPTTDYQLNVSVGMNSGKVIAELAARDADNEAAALTYRFRGQHPDFVALDRSGKLYLARDMRDSDRRDYTVIVEACDTDCHHATAQELRLLVNGERSNDISAASGKGAPLMWNLLVSIIIIVTTITVSCLLLVGILFLRKRIRKQMLVARERDQLRRSLQAANECKIKLAQTDTNPLNNAVMVSSMYDMQPKRPPTDFIVHQSIEHEPDCAIVEHLKWISNSQLLDPSSFYAKAPAAEYNSKYSTFVKYASNTNMSPDALYSDHDHEHVVSNQLNTANNSGLSSSGSNDVCNATALNVRTNLNDSNSSRSNSNNADNHFCVESNFSPASRIGPASSESKLSMATASSCRTKACGDNQAHLQHANAAPYNCTVHNGTGTMPKLRPHAHTHAHAHAHNAINQHVYGTICTNAPYPYAMHTFASGNRMQPESVEVIERGSVGRGSCHEAGPLPLNHRDQNCELPEWYSAHTGRALSPSPYSPQSRIQMHSPYGFYTEARVLPSGAIINAMQHQPMIPVKEFEGDEV